jgi:hypothetical protein
VLEGLSEEDMKMMTKAEVDKIKKDTEDRQRGEAWNAMQAFWYVLWQSNIGPVELMNSNTILSAARTIDISLKETKGAEFVKRMQASLPRLPDAQGHALMAEEKQGLSSASKEAVIKICTYSLLVSVRDVPTRKSSTSDEKWAGKVRFQYADLLVPGTDKYEHAYQKDIAAIAEYVRSRLGV